MNSMLPELSSLAVGVVTGLIFERRATREARKHSEDLQRQVSVLRASILSISGKAANGSVPRSADDLANLVTRRAIATQDAEGRVDRRALIAYFVERHHTPRDIDAAISLLCRAGIAEEDGLWMQMA